MLTKRQPRNSKRSRRPVPGTWPASAAKFLKRQRVVYDLEEAKRRRPKCQEPLKRIGKTRASG